MLEASKGEEGRVILIGGSGVAFSISAEELTRDLGRPVYNGGIQATIGYRNLIDLYAPYLDPDNDTIVLVPEPELIAGDARYSQTWCDVIYLRKAVGDLVRQPRCLPNIVHRTYQEVRHHMTGAQDVDPIYRRSGFNARGDMTAHLAVERPTVDFRTYSVPELDEAAVSRFEDTVGRAFTERGLAVLYVPSAVPQKACDTEPERLRALIDRLAQLSTVEVPTYDFETYCFAHDLFFDGAGHLNRRGRLIQTENVRRAISYTVVHAGSK